MLKDPTGTICCEVPSRDDGTLGIRIWLAPWISTGLSSVGPNVRSSRRWGRLPEPDGGKSGGNVRVVLHRSLAFVRVAACYSIATGHQLPVPSPARAAWNSPTPDVSKSLPQRLLRGFVLRAPAPHTRRFCALWQLNRVSRSVSHRSRVSRARNWFGLALPSRKVDVSCECESSGKCSRYPICGIT